MYRVLLLPLAKKDIKAGAMWYEEKQVGLGKIFLQKVREKADFIRQNPTAIAVRYDQTRCAILDTFPFMIHFQVEESEQKIIISAVFHSSRNPKQWTKR
jgi:plasmid stabilization system protein ParE